MEIKGNGDLPQELLLDILLRLPVKILSRCKCVSKNWFSLIESLSFVKQHFESSQERLLIRLRKTHGQEGNESAMAVNESVVEPEEPDHQQMPDEVIDYDYAMHIAHILGEREHEGFHDVYALFNGRVMASQRRQQMIYKEGCKYALYVDDTFSEYEDPIHLQIPDGASDVFGPLNGVFCVVSQFPWGPMALLNPALRQFKPLPLVQQMDTESTSLYTNVLGMGLDPLTGDFKLVLILYFTDMNMDDIDYKCVVSVCTSDSDSWRVLEDVDSINLSRSPRASLCNTYMNGTYYWLMNFNHTTEVAILAFDMGTDKFREIHVDGCVAESRSGHLSLCRDSLALLVSDFVGTSIDVWLMANEGCWIKSARIGPLQGIRRPLCFWKDELLFETMAGFLSQCNAYTQELKTFEAKRTDQWSFSHWVFLYKESLVSIKGKTGKCKLWDTSSNFVKDFFNDSSSEKAPVVV